MRGGALRGTQKLSNALTSGTKSGLGAAAMASRSFVVGTMRYQGTRQFSAGPQYKDGIHRSNAEKLINEVPVIEVDAHVAVCDGGSGALGHPIEYIQLDTISNEPQTCKYCGLRYKMAHH